MWQPGRRDRTGRQKPAIFRDLRNRTIALGMLLGTLSSAAASEPVTTTEIVVGECKTTYQRRVTFSMDRTGLIAAVPEEGQSIRSGEVIIQLQDAVPRANLALAAARASDRSPILVEQVAAETAKLDYESALEANRLSGGGVLAYPPLHLARLRLAQESAQLKVKVAEREHRLQELARDQAQAELEGYRVVAGLNGTVVQVFKQAGEVVQAGEPIVELVNRDCVRVEGFVSLPESARIHPGLPVTLQFEPQVADAKPLSAINAQLGFVDVSVQSLSGRVRVWADVPNPDHHLREGLAVRLVIPLSSMKSPGSLSNVPRERN
jgi:multidrug efflux pump subunit AcrA (membrane-fusion protein)